MDRLVAMIVDEGESTLTVFEVAPTAESGLELAADDGMTARARVTLDHALQQVRPALVKVSELVQQLAPAEAEIEFGLKVGGETGIIVAKGTSEVNFAVRLTWKRTEPRAGDAP